MESSGHKCGKCRSGLDHGGHGCWEEDFGFHSTGRGLSTEGFWQRWTQSLFCVL